MFNKEDAEKNSYSIGETAKILGIEQHVVRFWSNTFSDYIRPLRKAGERRYYSKSDIETLFKIKDMVYNQKYSLGGVKQVLQNTSPKLEPQPADIENPKLQQLHLKVLNLKKSIENFLNS
ncbi:MAG: MerR family transcriptional regulator [Alphaproteobacteria bacterium]|jgi:DNA-binding transcriptional MerR regulator|nr:MerR family transcriptional regulator [Alphaproteobacteria bacterium]